jgi:dGTPase
MELTMRLQWEEIEQKILASCACLSSRSKGRETPEDPCSIRTCFQRDRDRIIHSKAFRRLKHKTQVFLAPGIDHIRTRLTHTLEVTQIARTICRALRLNEDLGEAIALGHDLGHTPFGHTGERALNDLLENGFNHAHQSLKTVDYIEKNGLNLTYEVRDGILNHNGDTLPATLEGQVVKLADRIAYVNHDIDDSLRANVLKVEDLPVEYLQKIGANHRARINALVVDIISNTSTTVKFSSSMDAALNGLRDFMFQKVYLNPEVKCEEKVAAHIILKLYRGLHDKPAAIPGWYCELNHGNLDLAIADYIAGMTDNFAIEMYLDMFPIEEFHFCNFYDALLEIGKDSEIINLISGD